ncbi:MAG: transketolase C-terminal domain-containing protein, partial [Betaproteobacteria bacterium]
FEWGKGVVRRQAAPALAGQPRLAILAFGTLLHPALKAAEALNATVADMRFVKPLDADLVLELARSHDALVTIEDGCLMGGAGSAVLEFLQAQGVVMPVLNLGYPDVFIEHGDPAKLNAQMGLDAAGIERAIRERFAPSARMGTTAAAA